MFTNVCVKFVVVVFVSSARWVMSVAGMSTRREVAGCAIVAGSRCRSSRRIQLDDRCGKLRSVESLNAAAGRSLREAEVGRVVECSSWTIVAGS